jgi:SAM-dependent methyltransferase
MEIKDILNYEREDLVNFLRFLAGSSHSVFGGLEGGKFNLKLQQIPEEYSSFLLFLKKLNNNSYLELGVGQGGSFLVNSLFQEKCKIFHAVDSLHYMGVDSSRFWDQEILIKKRVNEILQIKKDSSAKFFNMSTDDFFIQNENTYDLIFIDADHSYEGVKKDYENSLKILNPGGYLIFHDIANDGVGVKKLWLELDNSKKIDEFVHSHNCGIGIYKP